MAHSISFITYLFIFLCSFPTAGDLGFLRISLALSSCAINGIGIFRFALSNVFGNGHGFRYKRLLAFAGCIFVPVISFTNVSMDLYRPMYCVLVNEINTFL